MTKRRHPWLTSKFIKFLRVAYGPNEKISGKTVPNKVVEWAERCDLTEEEIDLIRTKRGALLDAARRSGIIDSQGKKRGYKFAESSYRTEIIERDDLTPETFMTPGHANQQVERLARSTDEFPSILSEAFLHLPATFLLAHEFRGQVVSLPAKMEGRKWANPDMIMIHNNKLDRPDDNESEESGMTWEEQLALLSKVDNSPQYVITSVELKLALKNRTEVLNALSETALNGGWANQTILVYLKQAEDEENVFHEDALEFARKNGIGIYAIELTSDDESPRSEIRLDCILPAQTRTSLEVKSLAENKALFMRVLDLIRDYCDEGPLLGQLEDDSETLAKIVLQAMNNLEIQRDFTKRKDLCERLNSVKASNPAERELIQAIGQFLPTMLGDVTVEKSDFEKQLEELPVKVSGRIKDLYYTLVDEHHTQATEEQVVVRNLSAMESD